MYEGSRLVADFTRVSFSVGGKPIRLTRREFLILRDLIANQNQVMSRRQLIDRLWPDDQLVDNRSVDVHVGGLRAKLGSAARQIETVFGVGYRFVPEPS